MTSLPNGITALADDEVAGVFGVLPRPTAFEAAQEPGESLGGRERQELSAPAGVAFFLGLEADARVHE